MQCKCNTRRIDHLYRDPHNGESVRLYLHYGDISSAGNLLDVVYSVRPDEVYHLAAQSHVRVSFDLPEYTGDVTGLGTIRTLEAIRKSGVKARFYQASSILQQAQDASQARCLAAPGRPRTRLLLLNPKARMRPPRSTPIG